MEAFAPRLACASATSSSAVLLPRATSASRALRRGRATRSISRWPVARPTRSSTAISTAECAPPLPTRAAVQRATQRRPIAGILTDQQRRRDGRAPPRAARPGCRRSWSAPRPPRPSRPCRPWPRSAPAYCCAVAMVSPAIFIGALSGSATGMASMRRMTSGACSRGPRSARGGPSRASGLFAAWASRWRLISRAAIAKKPCSWNDARR